MKNLLYLLLCIISFGIIGCDSEVKQPIQAYQLDHIKNQIEQNTTRLKNKVLETGYSPAGKELIENSEDVNKKIDNLIVRLQSNEGFTTEDVKEIMILAKYSRDSIRLNNDLLTHALQDYKETRDGNSAILSLLLFNLDVTENYQKVFDNYFYHIDYMKPMVIANTFEIKKGQVFSGLAIMQSKMAAIKFKYEIDDPQTSEGFVELPSFASDNNDGIVRIKGLKIGKHTIKLRSTYWNNEQEAIFDDEFVLEVNE